MYMQYANFYVKPVLTPEQVGESIKKIVAATKRK
jgi:hypothetical protein